MVQQSTPELKKSDPKKWEENFLESAELFEKEKEFEIEAAKSYFSIKKYEKAKQLFLSVENYAEAGESILQMIKGDSEQPIKIAMYKEALENFDKAGNFSKAIECCQHIKDFKLMIKLLKKYENNIANCDSLLEFNMKKYIEQLTKKLKKNCNFNF